MTPEPNLKDEITEQQIGPTVLGTDSTRIVFGSFECSCAACTGVVDMTISDKTTNKNKTVDRTIGDKTANNERDHTGHWVAPESETLDFERSTSPENGTAIFPPQMSWSEGGGYDLASLMGEAPPHVLYAAPDLVGFSGGDAELVQGLFPENNQRSMTDSPPAELALPELRLHRLCVIILFFFWALLVACKASNPEF